MNLKEFKLKLDSFQDHILTEWNGCTIGVIKLEKRNLIKSISLDRNLPNLEKKRKWNMSFKRKSPMAGAKIFNFCMKIPCSKLWSKKKPEKMPSSTTLFKWETSSKKSNRSICPRIWRKGERKWAFEEENPAPLPALPPTPQADKEDTKNINANTANTATAEATNTNTEEKEAVHIPQKIQDQDPETTKIPKVHQRNHSNNPNCSKITSGIDLAASPKRTKMAI